MLISSYKPLAPVSLPYSGRQHYMHEIDLSNPIMLEGYEDYLEPIQDLLLAAGHTTGTGFMTVDEKIIPRGMSQRRPGPHVDGCFIPKDQHWGGHPAWNHHCNNVPLPRMSVIVAASVAGCKAWKGIFTGQPKNDGDLSHISDQLGDGEVLIANYGYLLSPDCVHESMIFDKPTRRSFLRIALQN